MKKTLALVVASTALTATIGMTAWSALGSAERADTHPITAAFDDGQQALPLILASGDDDDDEDRRRSRHDRDDDDDDDDHDDEDDDDVRGGRNPAPAGTVAPPANGLFGNGTPPQVQVN